MGTVFVVLSAEPETTLLTPLCLLLVLHGAIIARLGWNASLFSPDLGLDHARTEEQDRAEHRCHDPFVQIVVTLVRISVANLDANQGRIENGAAITAGTRNLSELVGHVG